MRRLIGGVLFAVAVMAAGVAITPKPQQPVECSKWYWPLC